MVFVSLTRLRIRSIRFVPLFAFHTFRSLRQVSKSPGFQSGSILADRSWTFWTLTVWDMQESMRAYIVSGSHKQAMPHLLHWCDEASVAHWTQPDATPPVVDRGGQAHARARTHLQGALPQSPARNLELPTAAHRRIRSHSSALTRAKVNRMSLLTASLAPIRERESHPWLPGANVVSTELQRRAVALIPGRWHRHHTTSPEPAPPFTPPHMKQ